MLPSSFTLLQVTPALDGGGVETLTVDMATAVAQAGARSLVAARGGRLEQALAWGGGELVRMPLDRRDPASLAVNAIRLARLIRREEVSLVHVRSRAPAFSALAAARWTRTPLVASYHGLYSAASPLKRWYNAAMTRGDAVIANSVFTREHIVAEHGLDPDEITLIPEGVDTEAFDPAGVSRERVERIRAAWGAAPGRPVALLAARLTGHKGHELAIRALARGHRREHVLLVFAGPGENGPLAANLLRLAKGAGVNLRIVEPCADMPAAYLAADFVAAPSTRPETFGRSVAEAAAMGAIVVASSLGAMLETVVDGETGFLVPAGDVEALAAAFERALAMTPAERLAMGTAAWRRIRERHSARAMYEATFDLYSRLVGGRG